MTASPTTLDINCALSYRHTGQCDHLVQIAPAAIAGQRVLINELRLGTGILNASVPGVDGIGLRHWITTQDRLDVRLGAQVEVSRAVIDLETLNMTALAQLGGPATTYLMPSRYCHPDRFFEFTASEFAGLSGGPLIAAMRAWVQSAVAYVPGASDLNTDAHDTYLSREGVCRDMAHLMISLARAVSVPARFVSVFSPDVTPLDFHAVVEVFLGGDWHMIDPSGMSDPQSTVVIGVGRDAADTAFLTSFGLVEFEAQSVDVKRRT